MKRSPTVWDTPGSMSPTGRPRGSLRLNSNLRPRTGSMLRAREHPGAPGGASDEFIIYEFDKKDTYPYVANYYGVSLSQIVADNRPADYLGTAGSSIFIRNPKQNGKQRLQQSG